MRARHFKFRSITTTVDRHAPRKVATRLTLGALAAALAVSAGTPAFAGKPHQSRPGGHHEQTQEHKVSAAKKGKGNNNKKKSVKKTFASDDAIAFPADGSALDIGPADPYPTTIAVTGFKKAEIVDVHLTLRSFSHEFAPDVDVLLVAPGGSNAVMMDEVGFENAGSGVANITLTLDDEAAAALPGEDVLTDGSFRPNAFGNPSVLAFPSPAPTPSGSVALSNFDGVNPNGEWQLFIADDSEGSVGSLADGWALEITAKSKVKNKGNGKKNC
jgi:subtilisin-like proprotein convertase family protein